MERAVRPPTRRKADGTKFDFRLHFHASRVPTSGWDKLVVSLLSIETGRITVRTSRGVVRNGSCQWPDPVVESAKLFQNPSTGECNDKLYKVFVQMGSLRAGILGEAMINLAEYVTAESPEAVSLALRNCSAGTVLHVKIQCLTTKAGIRDLEGQRISMLDQECPGSVSEDNSSSSDLSENPTSGSIGSSASQNVAALSFVSAFQGHHRNNGALSSARNSDELPSLAASQPNDDVVDYSSDISTSSVFFKGLVSAELQSFGPENHLLYRPIAVEFMNAKLSPPVKDYGAWVAAGLPQKLEAAEATIQELSEESLLWERQARKLAVEVETFRQKLAYESKVGSELKMKLSAAEAECDSLTTEVEQLKALKMAPKIRGGSENLSRWEMEDSRRMSKVLQEEIQCEKEANANLRMQLCKTQDSNANLITMLTELEEILEASNKIVEQLTEANKKLEEDLLDARRQLETSSKPSGEYAEVQSMNEGKWNRSSSNMEAIIDEKEQKIKWLESEVKELKSARIPNDEDTNSIKLESVPEESNKLNTSFMSKTEEFEIQIPELEAKIMVLEDAVHALEKERGVLLQKIEKETDLRTQLEAEIVKLGMEIDKLALDIAARDRIIENLNLQLADLKAERVALDGRLQNLLEKRQFVSSGMGAEKASVLEKLEEAHHENSRQSHRLEELVAELESSRNLLDSRASENEMLEGEKTELLVIQGKLEARICDLEEQDKSTSLDLLQTRLEQLILIVDGKDNVASQAVSKAVDLQAEKLNSPEIKKEKFEGLGQLSNSLEDLEIKLRDALMELDAAQISCDDLTQKLQEKECALHEQLTYHKKQEKDFQKKIGFLEEELLEKANMLSKMESQLVICKDDAISKENFDNNEVKVVLELQERLHCLEAEIKVREEELIACKKDFLQRETELTSKIECLELSNEQLAAGLNDSGAEQLQKELIRLQNQNSFLSRKEQELLSQMHTQEVLQEEVKRLQEANDLLEARLSKFVETAKNPFLLEKIVSLETELAESVEASNIYKLQLKSVFDKQQLGDLDQIIKDLGQDKKRATQLQGELDSMHERYTLISLKLAEAEAERGELMIVVKNLKGINKK